MTVGYIVVDRYAMSPAQHSDNCGGPSGLTASQIAQSHTER
jgi:hypothetical protein